LPIENDVLVIGLTGAFGSGCTTMALALETRLGFHNLKISKLIWDSLNLSKMVPDENGQLPLVLPEPEKWELQDHGDSFRRTMGLHYWLKQAIDQIDSESTSVTRIVLDGIRNPSEADWLRSRFNRFLLVAVDTPPETRWARLTKTERWKNKGKAEFEELSARDAGSHDEWGQQVQQCIDQADLLITNDTDLFDPKRSEHFVDAAEDLILLVDIADAASKAKAPDDGKMLGDLADPKRAMRRPTEDESLMHLAYTASIRSACLKRNVGAVIARPSKDRDPRPPHLRGSTPAEVLSIGYNENPDEIQPCYLQYGACYKDIWMKEEWRRSPRLHCPQCGKKTPEEIWPPKCDSDGCKQSLLYTIFPERGMTHCTAIHAEVRAIRNASLHDLKGSRLYSTTFPCFLCAQEIIQAGISEVMYVEAYPNPRSLDLLISGGVTVQRFRGLKSQAYDRFFRKWRTISEARYPVPSSLSEPT
jgi:deoxycytidylate deaminase/dephospho-CoA kinase